ncbi:RrF2 family transcriptional regulator [Spirochaeta thermophila]|uniref:Transcriptional regulator, BadM/Rrf2 family n=1 Tax=Winmispira thermophila (strain ATCC 49972 / DSM 6192 / RI 19.B1) TaxID=665571 RepID=E0RQN0_WINT6|nr:Rrf2 family transcriptional regulator [Spirochaeta thermophila]ADN01534.1 hypothetical protein STHERM_c05690 [Spirochaeta thermophila DSM 6192]
MEKVLFEGEAVIRIHRDLEYALIALAHLSRVRGLVSSRELASSTGLPEARLRKILQRLGRAGVLRAVQGVHGGYVLERSLSELTIGEVARALDERVILPCGRDGCEVPEFCVMRPGVIDLVSLLEQHVYSLPLSRFIGGAYEFAR